MLDAGSPRHMFHTGCSRCTSAAVGWCIVCADVPLFAEDCFAASARWPGFSVNKTTWSTFCSRQLCIAAVFGGSDSGCFSESRKLRRGKVNRPPPKRASTLRKYFRACPRAATTVNPATTWGKAFEAWLNAPILGEKHVGNVRVVF